jgi:flagellar FliL protein
MHSAESADLTDAGLGLIKRQLLEKTNRALGEPMLKEVLFSKFNFVER